MWSFTRHKVFCCMWPCVVRKQISCFYHCGSSFPASSPLFIYLFLKKPILSQNQAQQTALPMACEKPPREIFWKCCNLLSKKNKRRKRKKRIFTVLQPRLAWLGCTSPLYADPKLRKEIETRQLKPAVPYAPRHHLAHHRDDLGTRRLMAWRVRNGSPCLVPSPAYHNTFGMQP